MAIDVSNHTEVENQLWDEMEDAHLGMLGVMNGGPRHFQPMTPFHDRAAGCIWFFVSKSAEIVATLGGGKDAMFMVQAKDGRFQACIVGALSEDLDHARVDKYWNAATGAYFPKGKDDPELTMLRFDCVDGEIWHSEAGPLRFAWEVAKANLIHKAPDLGDRASVSLA